MMIPKKRFRLAVLVLAHVALVVTTTRGSVQAQDTSEPNRSNTAQSEPTSPPPSERRADLANRNLREQLQTFAPGTHQSDESSASGTSGASGGGHVDIDDNKFAIVSLQQPIALGEYSASSLAGAVTITGSIDLPDGQAYKFTSASVPSFATDFKNALAGTPYEADSTESVLDTFPVLSDEFADRAVIIGYALPMRQALQQESSLRRMAIGLEVWNSAFLQPMSSPALEEMTTARTTETETLHASASMDALGSSADSSGQVGISSSSDSSSSEDAISSWAPRRYASRMTNRSGVNDVRYWFRFTDGTGDGGAMRHRAFNHNTRYALEIGFKSTGKRYCNRPTKFMTGGYLKNARIDVRVDYEEDPTDAVVWISDLKDLKRRQLRNPNGDFFVSWECGTDPLLEPLLPRSSSFQQHLGTDGLGPFQVQLMRRVIAVDFGPLRTVISPLNSRALRTFNMVPAEQAHRGVPGISDLEDFHLSFNVPWPLNWNFESTQSRPWHLINNHARYLCCNYDAAQGGGYIHVTPTNTRRERGLGGTWLNQTFSIRGHQFYEQGGSGTRGTLLPLRNGQIQLGSNTGVIFEGYFRCPVWSPARSNNPGGDCSVRVWIKSYSHPTWRNLYRTFTIPSDGKWHHRESVEWWPAMRSDRWISIAIDTRGYAIDIDGIWVSSDL